MPFGGRPVGPLLIIGAFCVDFFFFETDAAGIVHVYTGFRGRAYAEERFHADPFQRWT
jgi:hypothetical protein